MKSFICLLIVIGQASTLCVAATADVGSGDACSAGGGGQPIEVVAKKCQAIHNFIEKNRKILWIESGQLAGMANPAINSVVATKIFHCLQKCFNVGLIVTLIEDPLSEKCQIEELEYLHIPLEAGSTPTMEQVQEFLSAVHRVNQLGKAVVVHCVNGEDRTGTMLACWLIGCKQIAANDAIFRVREGGASLTVGSSSESVASLLSSPASASSSDSVDSLQSPRLGNGDMRKFLRDHEKEIQAIGRKIMTIE